MIKYKDIALAKRDELIVFYTKQNHDLKEKLKNVSGFNSKIKNDSKSVQQLLSLNNNNSSLNRSKRAPSDSTFLP